MHNQAGSGCDGNIIRAPIGGGGDSCENLNWWIACMWGGGGSTSTVAVTPGEAGHAYVCKWRQCSNKKPCGVPGGSASNANAIPAHGALYKP